jgi:hypothetical protein
MNDIILNWRKINELMPQGNDNTADEAYIREHIKKMLEYSDLCVKIPYFSWLQVERVWVPLLSFLMIV